MRDTTFRRPVVSPFALVAILLFVGGEPALAAGGEAPRIVNFAILAVVLFLAVRKPLGGFLSARTDQIRQELKDAAENKERAAREKQNADERLAGLDQEIEEVRKQAVTTAQAERERILAAAREEAARIKQTAQREIEDQVEAGRRKLLARATELSVDLAHKKIASTVTEEDHTRLVDRSIELMGERN